MPPWFWGWLAAFAAFVVVALVARDWSAAAFAVGAALATALAALGAPVWAMWAAFLGVSTPLLALAVHRWYRGKHSRGAADGG